MRNELRIKLFKLTIDEWGAPRHDDIIAISNLHVNITVGEIRRLIRLITKPELNRPRQKLLTNG